MPAPEGPLDYVTQMLVLRESFLGFKSFWHFREKLFIQVGYDWVPKKGVRDRMKKEVQGTAFVLKRKHVKKEIKVYETRTVEMTSEQRKMYAEVKKKFKFGDLETKSAGTRQVWMQRLAGGFSPDRENPTYVSDAKVREVSSLLAGELKGEPGGLMAPPLGYWNTP